MLEVCFNSLYAEGCGWNVGLLWRSIGWLTRGDVTLLALMLVNTAVIICHRLYRLSAAGSQSCRFVQDAAAALHAGRFTEVISIAARNPFSHVATVVASGLIAFSSLPPEFTDAEAIDAAERAFQRSRKKSTADLKLGIGTLSTIASSAPFIGLLGTVFGISNAFVGTAGSRASGLAFVAASLAQALVTAAIGVAVAIPAVWCRNYLCERVAGMESEMSNAALEAVTYLHAHRHLRQSPEPSEAETAALVFRITRNPTALSWEVRYDRQRMLLLAMWSCMFYIAFIFTQGMYQSYTWNRAWERVTKELQPIYQQVGGQELISPDRRYRAVVPTILREATRSGSDKGGSPHWLCGSEQMVVLRIVPNDRPPAWKPHTCGGETTYALDPDEALLTWNCSVPVVTWRSNDELLAQCSNCAIGNVELAKPAFFLGKITLLGPDGKRIDPQVAHPQPQCLE